MSAPQTALERPRNEVAALPAIEWPTVALIVFAYGGWFTLTRAYGEWPTWIVAPCVAVLLTFHSSLQHEILHGHPTRSDGGQPLVRHPAACRCGFLTIASAASHLAHHVNDRLTDPIDDPESNYVTPEAWHRAPGFRPLDLPAPADAGRPHADRLVVADGLVPGARGQGVCAQ